MKERERERIWDNAFLVTRDFSCDCFRLFSVSVKKTKRNETGQRKNKKKKRNKTTNVKKKKKITNAMITH